MANRFKMWYIPQIPMNAFEVETDNVEEAKRLLEVVIDFSIFEFDNRVKPDYADAGGVMQWDETEQDWFDIDDEEDY